MPLKKEIKSCIRESGELYGEAETIKAIATSRVFGRGKLPCRLNDNIEVLQGPYHQPIGCKERTITPQKEGGKDGTLLNRERPIHSQKAIYEMIFKVLESCDYSNSESNLCEKNEKQEQRKECSLQAVEWHEKIGPGNARPSHNYRQPEGLFGGGLEGNPAQMNEKNASPAVPIARQVQLGPFANTRGVARKEAFSSNVGSIMANGSKMNENLSNPSMNTDLLLSILSESSDAYKSEINVEATKKRQVKGGDECIPGIGAAWPRMMPRHARHDIMRLIRNSNSIVGGSNAHEIFEILQYIQLVQSNLAKEDCEDSNGVGFRQNLAAFDLELPSIINQNVLDLKFRLLNVEFDEKSIRVATSRVLKFTKATGSGVMAIALLLQAYDNHCLDIGKLPYLYVLDRCLTLECMSRYGDHYAQHLYGPNELHLAKTLEPMIPHVLSGIRGIETCIIEAREILEDWTMRHYFSQEMRKCIKDFALNGFCAFAIDPRLNRKRKLRSE